MHPEGELAVWVRIAKGWIAYHETFLGNDLLPDDDERKLLGAILAISTGLQEVSMLGMPDEIGRRLIECYDDPAGE